MEWPIYFDVLQFHLSPYLSHIRQHLVLPLAEFISTRNTIPVPYSNGDTSLYAYWYLTPEQHAWEWLISPIVVVMGYVAFQSWYKDVCLLKEKPIQLRKRSLFHSFVTWLSLFSYLLTVYHKYKTFSLWFMTQPCHMLMLMFLVVTCIVPRSWHRVQQGFINVFVYNLWTTILALLSPDLRSHDLSYEVENFFLEHLLLLLAPAVHFSAERAYLWPADYRLALVSWSIHAIYHIYILMPLSWWTGMNLNYMMVPPPGPLEWVGIWYRPFMFTVCLLLSMMTRYFVVPVLAGWMKKQEELEENELRFIEKSQKKGKMSMIQNVNVKLESKRRTRSPSPANVTLHSKEKPHPKQHSTLRRR